MSYNLKRRLQRKGVKRMKTLPANFSSDSRRGRRSSARHLRRKAWRNRESSQG